MKKYMFLLLAIGALSFSFTHAAINEKVLRIFKSAFPYADNAVWAEYPNFYEVYFEKDNIKSRIDYDFEGNVLSTRRDYLEADLTPFIRSKVQKNYPDKKIFGITEITKSDEMFYVLILEDNKSWYHVQSSVTGDMRITDRFKKANP